VIFTVLAIRATAAELRVTLTELAHGVARVAAGAELRLDNAPSALVQRAPGSSLTIAGRTFAIPIPVRTFDRAGARYAYYLSDIGSAGIAVAPEAGALRLTITFEEEGAEFIGRCVLGLCPPVGALPEIEWIRPSLAIDLLPIQLGEALSLEVRGAAIGGVFQPRCGASGGLVSRTLCNAVLPEARAATSRLRADLEQGLTAHLNAPEVQTKLADGLKGYLAVGGEGGVRIRSVEVEAGVLEVSFCVAC